jgi:hypothetical protein
MKAKQLIVAVCLFLGAATAQVQNSIVLGFSDSACANVISESEIDFGDNHDCVAFDGADYASVRVAGGDMGVATDCTLQLWSGPACSGTLTALGPINSDDFTSCFATPAGAVSFNTAHCDLSG